MIVPDQMPLADREMILGDLVHASPQRRRQAAVAAVLDLVATSPHTVVRGTLRAAQARHDGEYATGWVVTLRVVIDGRAHGLADYVDLADRRIVAVRITT